MATTATPRHAHLISFVCGLVGVLVGLAASGTVGTLGPRRPAETSPPPADPPAHQPGATPRASTERELAAMEWHVSALESRPAASAAPTQTVPAPPASAISFEEARARHRAERAATLESHRHEPVDPSWAPRARESFEGDLAALTKTERFAIKEISCKTTTCTALAEFPTYGDALAQWRRILTAPYSQRCSPEVTLDDPPTGGAGPFNATFVFDCKDGRASEGR